MKLKIQPTLITFKLSHQEKKTLTQPGQSCTTQLLFPNGVGLSYTLRLVDHPKNTLSYTENNVLLEVSLHDFKSLDQPSKHGLVMTFGAIQASIEVDLRSIRQSKEIHRN